MRLLGKFVHPKVRNQSLERLYERKAVRAVVIKDNEILMIYTKRYDDYSLPGGGVESHEAMEAALIRELEEETGARKIEVKRLWGIFDETGPIHYPNYDAMHQLSYVYICDADKTLGDSNPEPYEIKNGSVPVWVPIDEAIAHNKRIIESQAETMGFYIYREMALLELIEKELISH